MEKDLIVSLINIRDNLARSKLSRDELDGEGRYKYKSQLYDHSWIEYFVPNIGWLACDPTYVDSGSKYFNGLDFKHIYVYTSQILYIFPIFDNSRIQRDIFLNISDITYPVYQISRYYEDFYELVSTVSIKVLETKLISEPFYIIIFTVMIICSIVLILALK